MQHRGGRVLGYTTAVATRSVNSLNLQISATTALEQHFWSYLAKSQLAFQIYEHDWASDLGATTSSGRLAFRLHLGCLYR